MSKALGSTSSIMEENGNTELEKEEESPFLGQ